MKLFQTIALILTGLNILNAQSNSIQIKNVEQINTTFIEFSPVYYQQGLVFVSSDSRHGKKDNSTKEKTYDLRYSDLSPRNRLSSSSPLSLKVNTRYHEGPICFSPDMNKMYFTRSNIINGNPIKSKDGKVKLKIYEATKGKDDWENIKELAFNSNEYSCLHPTISKDGQFLYFASDQPGGQGGMDLYYSKKIGDRWSAPVNLGNSVNTSSNEVFPYIHPSGKLFFASNRVGTMGGLDIFAIDYTEIAKGSIEQLPAPINSTYDDLGLILSASGKVGFFSSDRPGGKGKDDIYRAEIEGGFKGLFPPKVFDRTITVVNKETSETLEDARVVITEITEGKTPFEMNEIFEINLYKNNRNENLVRYALRASLSENNKAIATNNLGQVVAQMTATKKYIITATKEGFVSAYTIYSETGLYPKAIKIALWPVPKKVVVEEITPVLEVGNIIVLDQIYYDFGKSYIRTDASRGLEAILYLMNEYPQMTIELTSHTDSRGTKDFNMDLSSRRSGSAKYYLTSRGIAESRIRALGKGEQNPRNQCVDGVTCSEEEHQFNRRTEIKIVSLGSNKTIQYIDNVPEYIDRAIIKKRN